MRESTEDRLGRLTAEQRAALVSRVRARRAAERRTDRIPAVGRDEPLPLSFAQQRLWLLEQWADGTPAFNTPLALRLRGPLGAGSLRRAVLGVVERHEVLRTRYTAGPDGPRQVVGATTDDVFTSVDLGALDPGQREARAHDVVLREARRCFDLTRDPSLRATLVRLADDDHLLLLSAHHIATDAWSTDVLTREVVELYTADRAGRDPVLPELPVQFADHAVWERGPAEEERRAASLAHWRTALAGLDAARLPTDRPRPPGGPGWAGERAHGLLPAAAHRALAALGGTGRVLPLALAGLAGVLSRYTGHDDVAVGTTFAGRTRPEHGPLIGYFASTAVLRVSTAGDPSFRELLARADDSVYAAHAHQAAPFEQVVAELGVDREAGRNPLFQVALLQVDPWLGPTPMGDVVAEAVAVHTGTSRFDLTLNVAERAAGGVELTAEYATDLFDRDRVERLLAHFVRLLESAATRPDAPLSALDLLTDAERVPDPVPPGHPVPLDHVVPPRRAEAVVGPGSDVVLGALDALRASGSYVPGSHVPGGTDLVVDHRTVLTLFDGLDLRDDPPGTWLAVGDPSAVEALWALSRGFTVVLADADADLAALVREHGVTHLRCAPAPAALLADDTLSRLDVLLVGGGPVPADLARRLRDAVPALHVLHGLPGTTAWVLADGAPLAGRTARVLDRLGRPQPVGVPGELHLGLAGRFHRTGDAARRLADGTLEVLDRPEAAVEAALRGHPGVRAAVVTGTAAHLVAADPGATPPADTALRAHLRPLLPARVVPTRFAWLGTLPLTPGGEVDHARLPAIAPPEERATPTTPAEHLLVEVWQEVLGLDRVDVRANFFGLGGTSLSVVAVVAGANRRGLPITARRLFEHQTIAELAEAVATDPVVALSQDGSTPPLLCLHARTGPTRRLPAGRPWYALEPPDHLRDAPAITHLAAHYAAVIRRRWPQGPHHLVDRSPATLAEAVATELRAAGREVGLIAALHPAPPGGATGVRPPSPGGAVRVPGDPLRSPHVAALLCELADRAEAAGDPSSRSDVEVHHAR
ncbi:condensation domain-containing protein [Saccharothrix longispora]|uniref:Carrier domain-containing protein n=1 Tax=Saccharothrix longispora TaxID=33920 RepID=A0ABU1PTL4_9PSEU|nr:condensation domain-containing protein [Saccharothrix longispora]MDR6593986.1 hypothetical protein [Saccharothrix longispora]